MTFELIDIAVADKQPHPRLPGRITGHVRAVLSENAGTHRQNHDLTIPVWANTTPDATDADIDMALMLKAATIIARLKANLSNPTG